MSDLNLKTRSPRRTERRRGAVLALMAVLLPVALILAAFAINVAYMELTRTELYTATDAATRAAQRTLTNTRNQGSARAQGRAVGLQNHVAGKNFHVQNSEFTFGTSTRASLASRYVFTPATGPSVNAVQVNGSRMAASHGGVVDLVFPFMLSTQQFETQEIVQSTQVDVDIALVIDRSGSMAYAANETAAYPPPPAAAPVGWTFCTAAPPNSRWLDLVNGVDVFINEIQTSPRQELISLSSYADSASVDQPLTTTYTSIQTAMNVYTTTFCGGMTNIASGIDTGVYTFTTGLDRPWAAKVLVVLTDGIATAGGDPLVAAANAAAQNIQIFTITFALEADQTLMQQIATIGKGRHYHATNGSELATAFQDIARGLPVVLTR